VERTAEDEVQTQVWHLKKSIYHIVAKTQKVANLSNITFARFTPYLKLLRALVRKAISSP
jgi:hypothetical protein